MASMAAIGDELKKAREKKGVTIDQARKQTHIHSTVLIALEEGRCDDILTPTYVKSFLKEYAGYLGLDAKEIVSHYAALHHEPQSQSVKADDLQLRAKDAVDILKFINMIRKIFIVILVLVLIAFLGKYMIAFFKKPRPIKAIQVSRKKSYIPSAKVTPQKKTPPPENKSDIAQVSIPKKEPLNLVLKVKKSVLVGLKRDGVALFKRVLPKGTTESFTADESLNIYVAKAEAIDLILNGKDLGSPGKGIIKNLEITRKGVRTK